MQTYNRTIFYIMTTLCAIFSYIGIWTDKPFIQNNYDYYVIGRILWGTISLALGIKAYFSKDIKPYVILQLINMMAYSVHGQFFVSCYYLGFLQLTIINGVAYPIPKKQYQAITFIGAILLIFVILNTSSSYTSDPVLLKKFQYDCIMSILIFTFASNWFHKYITMAREDRDKISLKFADIGKNASYILHDFKGLMVSPAVYSSLINMELENKNIEDAKKHAITLENDLNYLQKYLKEINGLTTIDSEIAEKLNLNEIINSLKIILKNKIMDIEFEFVGDETFLGKKTHFKKILYNLIMNSVEAMSQINNKKVIKIEVKNNKLIYQDSGPGFPLDILKNLNKRTVTYNTGKNYGSGLGTAIIKEIVFSNNGEICFYNNESGAVVEIEMKK